MEARKDYIGWDEYFMAIAKLSAMRSKDPSTQVGACIVSNDNRILSIGYNGAPNGYNDERFPWGRDGDNLNTKYPYVCHSEMNAILNYRGSKKDLEDAKIYVDYLDDKYKDSENNIASRKLFDECGVTYKKLDLGGKKEIKIEL